MGINILTWDCNVQQARGKERKKDKNSMLDDYSSARNQSPTNLDPLMLFEIRKPKVVFITSVIAHCRQVASQ